LRLVLRQGCRIGARRKAQAARGVVAASQTVSATSASVVTAHNCANDAKTRCANGA